MRYVTEGPTKITRATVEAGWRKRRDGVRLTIRDAECRGLALVVNPTGIVWRFSYKLRGIDPTTGRRPATRTLTLGTHKRTLRKERGPRPAGSRPTCWAGATRRTNVKQP